MAAKPTRWNRLVATLQGEVPAAELEALRRASGPVFELLEQVERRRLECRIDGIDPWAVPPATRAAFLCAWNAFVLQTLGNELLDADYRAEPRTPHFVPPETAEQVLGFYEQVEGWVNRAWQAQANPDYRLDVPVPAPLPAWRQADAFPAAHLDGLLHAMRSVRDHADAAMAFLPTDPPEGPQKRAELNRIRQLYASAQARARYAEDLCGTDPVPQVRERAGEHARAALEQLYQLGQLIADPDLADEPLPAPAPPPRQTPALTPAVAGARTPAAETPPRASTMPAAGPLRTRHDRFKHQTIIEHTATVEFTGDLPYEITFELRLTRVRSGTSQAVVLRVHAWSFVGWPHLGVSTLTVHTSGRNTVLRPLADSRMNASRERKRQSFEAHVGYEFPATLLDRLCRARQAGLLFETFQGRLEMDADAVARFQSCCRAFRAALAADDPDAPGKPGS